MSKFIMRNKRTLHLNLLVSVMDSSLYNLEDILDWSLWWPDLNYVAVMVQKIFVEIPLWNNSRIICQIFPNWTGICSMNLNLLKDWKPHPVLVKSNLTNLIRISRLLVPKLVTGKC